MTPEAWAFAGVAVTVLGGGSIAYARAKVEHADDPRDALIDRLQSEGHRLAEDLQKCRDYARRLWNELAELKR